MDGCKASAPRPPASSPGRLRRLPGSSGWPVQQRRLRRRSRCDSTWVAPFRLAGPRPWRPVRHSCRLSPGPYIGVRDPPLRALIQRRTNLCETRTRMTTTSFEPITVDPFSDALAARTSELLEGAGTLSEQELATLVTRITERPDLWQPLVVIDRDGAATSCSTTTTASTSGCSRGCRARRPGFTTTIARAWLSSRAGGARRGKPLARPAGGAPADDAGVVRTGPGGYIHSVSHVEGEPAVSIHAYSPPLTCVGQYRSTRVAVFGASRSTAARSSRTRRCRVTQARSRLQWLRRAAPRNLHRRDRTGGSGSSAPAASRRSSPPRRQRRSASTFTR